LRPDIHRKIAWLDVRIVMKTFFQGVCRSSNFFVSYAYTDIGQRVMHQRGEAEWGWKRPFDFNRVQAYTPVMDPSWWTIDYRCEDGCFRCTQVAWQFQTQIRFPAVKLGFVLE
jgi:hypothetical protein